MDTLEKTVGQWSIHSNPRTRPDNPVAVISMTDPATGIIFSQLLPNRHFRAAVAQSWHGARYSRSPQTAPEIMQEIWEKDVDADEKVNATVRNYGHKSVADMANQQPDADHIPMLYAYGLFNWGFVNAGQERSTRFQGEFQDALLYPINQLLPPTMDAKERAWITMLYQTASDINMAAHKKLREKTFTAFREYFRPEEDCLDTTSAQRESALQARVFDTARALLPLGGFTGLAYNDNTANFSRIIRESKGAKNPFFRDFGSGLETFLAPTKEVEEALDFVAQAPGLIRHTEAQPVIPESVEELRRYLTEETDFTKIADHANSPREHRQDVRLLDNRYTTAEKMAAQYALAGFPEKHPVKVFEWMHAQPPAVRRAISHIINPDLSHHKELPGYARTNEITLFLDTPISENRDMNRHRAWGRFGPGIPIPASPRMTASSARGMLNRGWVLPLYLTEIEEMQGLANEYRAELEVAFENAHKFVDALEKFGGNDVDYTAALLSATLALRQPLFLHGSPQDAHYMPRLRERPGGHINYRTIAAQASALIAKNDDFMHAWGPATMPKPDSREEFFDRS